MIISFNASSLPHKLKYPLEALFTLSVVALFVLVQYAPTFALSPDQLDIFQNHIYYFNAAACTLTDTGTTTAPDNGNTIPAGGKDVGASEFTDSQGYHGDSLDGTYSYAELSPLGTAASDVSQNTATALGGLAYRQKLAITYQGKTVVAEKLDIGQGGSDVNGKSRDIDLHYSKTAQALGINDPNSWTGVVHVEEVVDSTALGPVSDPSTLTDSNGSTATTPTPAPSGCCSSSPTTTLTGSDNEEKSWNYFKGQGLGDVPVAAIMGNLMQESSFNPEEIESGGNSQNPADAGSGGWGLAQWTPGAKVLDEARNYHISGPIYELATQLNIIWAEMKGTSPTGVTDMEATLKQKTDLADATSYFVTAFEGPQIVGPRLTYAQQALQKYGGSGPAGSPGAGSSGDCTASSGSSPNCVSATGNTKILCEAKKYDPVDYVFGGGHAGGSAYHNACPTIQANNSSCGLDCSGLVSVAVFDAFSNNKSWDTVAIATDNTNWKEVQLNQLQSGDVIEPDSGHVEIVDHVQSGTVFTFGAHTDQLPQPDQVGSASYPNAASFSSYRYFRYVGQGASS